MTKQDLQEQVYQPMKELKDRFYAAETPEIWEECKEELIELLTKAETVMDKDWYEKWKQSQFDSITKMHTYKVKYWEKGKEKKVYQPKTTFLLQDELASALTKYIELQTKLLELQYENIFKK